MLYFCVQLTIIGISGIKTTSSSSEPLDFDKILLLFRETDRQFKETEKMFQETDRRFQKTDEKFQKTDEKLNKLERMLSGIGINMGQSAEQYFKSALEKRSELRGIRYEHVDSFSRRTKKMQGEYDVVLFNGDTIIIVEVKQKVHPSDIPEVIERRIPRFRELFPEYSGKKLIGCLAGMDVPEDCRYLAERAGLLVLVQSNEDFAVLNSEGSKPLAI